MKIPYIIILLFLLGCYDDKMIIQSDPELIFRPGGAKWYAASCLNFSTHESIEMNYITHHDEVIDFWFMIDGKYVGSLYIGSDSSTGRVEKRGTINGLTFEYYQNLLEKRYLFHTGVHPNAYAPNFFELTILKGYESEMKSVLKSITIGGPEDYVIDFETKVRIEVKPIPIETKSFMSRCRLRWDTGREFRDGIDWVAVLRNAWHNLGGDWIPLEGERDYPKVSDHLER